MIPSANGSATVLEALPYWDGERRELRLFGRLVKRFRQPARDQELILMAFAELGWPPRIDSPLTPTRRRNPKRRLLDTIENLNRAHVLPRVLRFRGDGTGLGICWETVEARAESDGTATA